MNQGPFDPQQDPEKSEADAAAMKDGVDPAETPLRLPPLPPVPTSAQLPTPAVDEGATVITPRPSPAAEPQVPQAPVHQTQVPPTGLPVPAAGEAPTLIQSRTEPPAQSASPANPTGLKEPNPAGSEHGRTTKLPVGSPGSWDTIAHGATILTPPSVSMPGPSAPGAAAPGAAAPEAASSHVYNRPFSQGGSVTGPGSLTASSGPLAPGGLIAGRYRVQRVLGIGGMGEVYHVVDEVLEIEVALKVMRSEMATDPSFLQRFRNELLVARQISHPHVVRIHDIGQDGSLLFMTMDLVRGRSLGDVMKSGPMKTERAVAIIRQVADALAVAHRKNVVHRDLKPANILIDEAGDAFVTDFGIARSHSFSGLTRTGEVLGTPDYLAPEQARGEPVDGRADLYALGLIFFEMVTGERPFTGGTLVEILAQHMHGQTRSFQDVALDIHPGLQAIIRRCMETAPADRYPNAEALVEDLEDLDRPRRRAEAEKRRLWWKKTRKNLAAGAAVLALALGGYWAVDRLRQAPETVSAPVELQPLPTVLILPLSEDGDDTTVSDLDAWAAWGIPDTLRRAALSAGNVQLPPRARVDAAAARLGARLGRLGDADLAQLADLFDAELIVFGTLQDSGTQWALDLKQRTVDGISPLFEGEVPAADIGSTVDAAAASWLAQLAPDATLRPSGLAGTAPEVAASYYRGRLKTERQDASAELDLRQVVNQAPELALGHFALADLLDKMGRAAEAGERVSEALALWQAAGDRSPEDVSFDDLSPEEVQARYIAASLAGDAEAAVTALSGWVDAQPGDLGARFELANLFGNLSRLDEAISTLDVAKRLDPTDHHVWYFLGRYSIVAGDPGRAVDDYLVEAVALARRADDKASEAQILNALGIGYQHLGKPEQAGRRYAEAGELYQEVGDRNGYAKAQLNLGRLSTSAGRYAEAEAQLAEALQTFEAIGNVGGQTDAVNDTGVLLERQGRYDEALDFYRQALRLRLDAGDRLKAAESYHNVGFVHLQTTNYSDAILNLEQASTIYEELANAYGLMVVKQTRAGVHMARGAWDEAATDLLSALTTSRELQTPLVGAASNGELARLAASQARFSEALDLVDKALAVVEEQKNPRGRAEYGLVKAETLLLMNAVDAAEPVLDQVEAVLAEADNPSQRSYLLRLRGKTAELRGDLAAAAPLYADAVSKAELGHDLAALWRARIAAAFDAELGAVESLLIEARRLGSSPLELVLEESLARAHLRSGDLPQTEKVLRRALTASEKIPDYGRRYVLQDLLAGVLEEADDPASDTARAAADAAHQAVLANVPEPYQAQFGSPAG